MKTPEGKSRNFAFINFSDEESVPYAHSLLDGILLFGRALSVRFRDGSVHKARELEENERRARQMEADSCAQQAALLQRMQQHSSSPLSAPSTPLTQRQRAQPNNFQSQQLLPGQLGFSVQPFQFGSANPYSALSSIQMQAQSAYQSTPFAVPHARQSTYPSFPIPTHISGGQQAHAYTSQRSGPHDFQTPTRRDERYDRNGSFAGWNRDRSRSPPQRERERERGRSDQHSSYSSHQRQHAR